MSRKCAKWLGNSCVFSVFLLHLSVPRAEKEYFRLPSLRLPLSKGGFSRAFAPRHYCKSQSFKNSPLAPRSTFYFKNRALSPLFRGFCPVIRTRWCFEGRGFKSITEQLQFFPFFFFNISACHLIYAIIKILFIINIWFFGFWFRSLSLLKIVLMLSYISFVDLVT